MQKVHDVIIVGGGPAGLFAAYHLAEHSSLDVLLIEKGRDSLARNCPLGEEQDCIHCKPCNILSGMGGAGLFSDGKLNFIPKLGKTDLTQFMSLGKATALIDETEVIFNRFGMDGKVYPTNIEEARLLRGARMVTVLKHMGYAGVHLGGNNLDFNKIAFLLDQAEHYAETANLQEMQQEVHFPTPSTWYLFPKSGQQNETPHSPSTLFRVNQQIHDSAFQPKGLLFPLTRAVSLRADQHNQARSLYTLCEQLIKTLLFRCRMCGDCTLAESSYLCPQSGCPKRMINGPCGGSLHGFCEVYPQERLCFWVKVYNRNPAGHPEALSHCPPLPPKDWSLQGSSSWINYFTGRDHNKLGSAPK